jgi:PPM family protein phosphatase
VQTQCHQSDARELRPAPAGENVGCETLWAEPLGRHLQIEYAGSSDVGRVRRNNEDRFVIADLSRDVAVRAGNGQVAAPHGISQATVLAVADGLGGHTSGELAGRIAVDSLLKHLAETMAWPAIDDHDLTPLLEELGRAVEICQTAIFRHTAANPETAGMGTTLTTACIVGPYALLAHAGDSRCYLYREGELRRLTTDHTVARRLVERGELDAEEAAQSRWNHVLWKVLGGSNVPVEPDLSIVEVFPGDFLLLCTDGITKHLNDDRLAEMLADGRSAASICRSLIQAANDEGGSDNVTAVVARLSLDVPGIDAAKSDISNSDVRNSDVRSAGEPAAEYATETESLATGRDKTGPEGAPD